MKFRNYCKRLEVEAKVYRAMGEQQKHKGINRDAQKDAKAMQKGDVLRSKGVPLCRDGKEWQERQARAKGETTRAWKHTSESPKSDTL